MKWYMVRFSESNGFVSKRIQHKVRFYISVIYGICICGYEGDFLKIHNPEIYCVEPSVQQQAEFSRGKFTKGGYETCYKK